MGKIFVSTYPTLESPALVQITHDHLTLEEGYSTQEIVYLESKNDIVVFCHDDIIFNKDGWGKKLINHFKKSDYAILGIAGTTDMSSSGRWWEDSSKMMGIVKHSNNGKTWESKYCANFEDEILESVVLDGLFFACHKDRIKNKFDDDFKGFHFYDIDFTFKNHLLGSKVGVIFDVKVTHMSIGQTNDVWEKNRIQFVEKYKKDKLKILFIFFIQYHI